MDGFHLKLSEPRRHLHRSERQLPTDSTPVKPTPLGPMQLADWLDRIDGMDLPLLGSVLGELRALAADADTSTYQLAEVILKDPNLTALVLRMANSAYYNPGALAITTVSRAIILLGVSGVLSIAVSAMVIESLADEQPRPRLLEALARSFHAAVQARNLASRLTHAQREEVFIAALLFNVGELVLWSMDDPRVAELDRRMTETGGDLADLSKELLGISFSALNKSLAQQWELGEVLQSAQRAGQSATASQPVRAVVLGEQIAQALADPEAHDLEQLLEAAAELMGLSEADAKEQVRRTTDEAVRVAEGFGLHPLSDGLAYLDPGTEASDDAAFDPRLQLEILREASTMVVERADLNALLQVMTEGVQRGLKMDRVALLLVDERSQRLRAQQVVGRRGTQMTAWRNRLSVPLDADHNLFTALLAQPDLFCFDRHNAEHQRLCRGLLGQPLARSGFLVAPLAAAHRVIGFFYADRSLGRRSLDDEVVASFRHFAEYTTLCLTRLVVRR